MPKLLVVTALDPVQTDDSSALAEYVHLLRESCGQTVEVQVALPVGSASGIDCCVVEFPEGANRASVYNQIVAEWEGDFVLLLDGPVILSERGLPSLTDGTDWTDVPGRRLLALPSSRWPVPFADLAKADFGRDIHPLSPLGILVSRQLFMHLRGFDEAPGRAGAVFMDFMHRLSRSPGVLDRRRAPEVVDLGGVLPSLRADPFEIGRSARERYVEQVLGDGSLYRNLVTWSVARSLRPLLVTVVIATRNRAAYLREALQSVLAQDFREFEVIVVDDGSEDATPDVVAGISDPRVRYIRQEQRGISAARNLAADASQGWFTAVHDDDDLMLPWRLSAGLSVLDGEHMASYGSWVNFDDVTAQLTLHLTPVGFGIELLAHNGQTPGHATWLLPTYWVQAIRYDEQLASSIDHNLAVRTVISGLKWKHTEKVHYLRRLHPTQVSQVDSRRQRSTAVITRFGGLFGAPHAGLTALASKGKDLPYPKTIDRNRLFEAYGAFLPDHLVRRTASFRGLVGKKVLTLDIHDRFDLIASEFDLKSGKVTLEAGGASSITWDDIVAIQTTDLRGVTYHAARLNSDDEWGLPTDPEAWLHERVAQALEALHKTHPAGALLVVGGEQEASAVVEFDEAIALRRALSVNFGDGGRKAWNLLGWKSARAGIEAGGLLRADGHDVHIFVAAAAEPSVWIESVWEGGRP